MPVGRDKESVARLQDCVLPLDALQQWPCDCVRPVQIRHRVAIVGVM